MTDTGNGMGALLEAPVPVVSPAEVVAMARLFYGLDVSVRPLAGERDRNFHLRAADGREYALRVINPEEDAGVSDFQSRALEHLALSDPGVPVPRLRRPAGLDGCEAVWQPEEGRACRVRVLDYLQGQPLHLAPPDRRQRRAVGACLARLDAALASFRHPSEHHELIWDIQHAARLRGLLPHVPDAGDRAVATRILDRFEADVRPVLDGLRRQVIHNDFNPHNILVHPDDHGSVTGIIDFGDIVRAPRVQDLATAGAYQIEAGGHPLDGPADLAAAYHAVLPLSGAELGVLPELVATRLVTTVLISGLRARRKPENAAYILRNYGRSIAALRRLADLSRTEAQSLLLERLGT